MIENLILNQFPAPSDKFMNRTSGRKAKKRNKRTASQASKRRGANLKRKPFDSPEPTSRLRKRPRVVYSDESDDEEMKDDAKNDNNNDIKAKGSKKERINGLQTRARAVNLDDSDDEENKGDVKVKGSNVIF